jgi:cyanophycinase
MATRTTTRGTTRTRRQTAPPRPRLRKTDRTLVIIGGHEDKDGDRTILREVAQRVGAGPLVVTTVASDVPDELWEQYQRIFRGLGVSHLRRLDVGSREEATAPANVELLRGAAGVFFTGGDQLKITSQIGDTPVYQGIREIYDRGGVVCGTSAGASVMTETMLVSGDGDASHRIGGALHLAPGLGLLPAVIVDQHFAERGRIGRLLGAVAQNPRMVGIGIDEDTAVVVQRGRFRVLGSGAVYVVDGRHTTYSNLTSESPDRTMSVFDVKLHVLSQGDVFDLRTRRPKGFPAEAAERVTRRESRTPTAV